MAATLRHSEQAGEPSAPSLEHGEGSGDRTARLRQLLGVGKRELLTIQQVMNDYAFPSTEAARKFVHRHVPFLKRGRRVLVDRRDIDAAIQPSK